MSGRRWQTRSNVSCSMLGTKCRLKLIMLIQGQALTKSSAHGGWARRISPPWLLRRHLRSGEVNSSARGRTVCPSHGEAKLHCPNYRRAHTRAPTLRQSSLLMHHSDNKAANPLLRHQLQPPRPKLPETGMNCSKIKSAADRKPPRHCHVY